jgi:hypothetical protein
MLDKKIQNSAERALTHLQVRAVYTVQLFGCIECLLVYCVDLGLLLPARLRQH